MVQGSLNELVDEPLFEEFQRARADESRQAEALEIRNSLVEKYLFLADMFAKRYMGRGIDYDDLYQVAAYALMQAVDRYEPERGLQFGSFATPTIVGELKKYFRDTAWALKVPRRLKDLSMQIPAAREELYSELGRPPMVPELAKRLGVSDEDILEALESGQSYQVTSLDIEPEENPEIESQLEKYLGIDEEGYQELEAMSILEKVLEDLNPKEREVIKKRLLEEMTQREVADALGLSQMTVSRLEKAMKRKFETEYYK